METYELFKNSGMIAFVLFLIYFIFISTEKMKNVKEGLKNNNANKPGSNNTDPTINNNLSINQNINGNVMNGIAGNAASYASSIKNQVIKLQDILLISKYKSDYENVVINMHDLVNNLMLQTVLNIDPNDPSNTLDTLINLNEANNSLNNVMSYLDTH